LVPGNNGEPAVGKLVHIALGMGRAEQSSKPHDVDDASGVTASQPIRGWY